MNRNYEWHTFESDLPVGLDSVLVRDKNGNYITVAGWRATESYIKFEAIGVRPYTHWKYIEPPKGCIK